MTGDITTHNTDKDLVECDRCGDEIGGLQPVTNIQFSGAVDALRTACYDCMQEIIDAWNEGDSV